MSKILKNRILIQPVIENGQVSYEAKIPSWGASVFGGGSTPMEALEDLMIPVEDVLQDTAEEEILEDDPIPEWSDFSGKLTIRLPKDLHFKAYKYAQLSNQSLNSLVQVAVASYLAAECSVARHDVFVIKQVPQVLQDGLKVEAQKYLPITA